MKILVFEPAKGGHHLFILRYLVEDLLAGGHQVALACEYGPAPSETLRKALPGSIERCEWLQLSNGPGRLVFGKRVDAATRAAESSKADLVFFACLDEVTSGLFRRAGLCVPPPRPLAGKVTGIFVRPRVLDARIPAPGALKLAGFRRLMRAGWFRSLFVLDETLPSHLRRDFSRARVTPLPDPWSGRFDVDKYEAREKLGLPADKFLYLHYGTSSRRKGLSTLVNATAQIHVAEHCALVAAGRFTERKAEENLTLAALARTGRAYLFDRYIEDHEEPLFFSACDAVVLAYQGHYGSSNVQSRAAAAGRPIISSDEGLVGHRTKEHRLGLTFPTGNADGLAAGLLKLRDCDPHEIAPGLVEYAALHSRNSFRDALLSGL